MGEYTIAATRSHCKAYARLTALSNIDVDAVRMAFRSGAHYAQRVAKELTARREYMKDARNRR